MTLEDMLRDKDFLMKMMWIGFYGSLVLIAIGLYVMMRNIFG